AYDYKVPAARRYGSGEAEFNQGEVERDEIYDYVGLHGFDSSDRGEDLARFRVESLAASG
ncbi:hypothetical protein AAHH80_39015, partial [Burkholderia pseudomallei]